MLRWNLLIPKAAVRGSTRGGGEWSPLTNSKPSRQCWPLRWWRAGESKMKEAMLVHHLFCTICTNRYFKGITNGICLLLFVNTAFKVGPSSLAQSACASGGPTCLQSGYRLLCFHRVPHFTPCMLLLAGGYTPLPKGWCPETSRTQQNKKIQAEGRISADTDTTTHF